MVFGNMYCLGLSHLQPKRKGLALQAATRRCPALRFPASPLPSPTCPILAMSSVAFALAYYIPRMKVCDRN